MMNFLRGASLVALTSASSTERDAIPVTATSLRSAPTGEALTSDSCAVVHANKDAEVEEYYSLHAASGTCVQMRGPTMTPGSEQYFKATCSATGEVEVKKWDDFATCDGDDQGTVVTPEAGRTTDANCYTSATSAWEFSCLTTPRKTWEVRNFGLTDTDCTGTPSESIWPVEGECYMALVGEGSYKLEKVAADGTVKIHEWSARGCQGDAQSETAVNCGGVSDTDNCQSIQWMGSQAVRLQFICDGPATTNDDTTDSDTTTADDTTDSDTTTADDTTESDTTTSDDTTDSDTTTSDDTTNSDTTTSDDVTNNDTTTSADLTTESSNAYLKQGFLGALTLAAMTAM